VNEDLVATAAAAKATRMQPPRNKKGVPAQRLTYPEKLEPVARYSKPAVPEIQPAPALAFNEPPTDDYFTAEEVLQELEAQPEAPRDEASGECVKEWEHERPLPYLHVGMDPNLKADWVAAYQDNPVLLRRWTNPDSDPKTYRPGRRYVKDVDELLYFYDADFVPRLCVPRRLVPFILKEAHDSPFESAHAGYERLWLRMRELYFWPSMKKDVVEYCESCDICQKIKTRNFGKFGFLRPQSVPQRPYQSISLDLIGPLPLTKDGFSAILVIVDRLSKHAQFIPTDFDLNTEGFGYLFVKHVVCRYGLPDTVYADRDGRWLSEFWTAVSSYLKSHLVLSSARHPQHDGQTEIVNKQVEVMLRAYVAEDQITWSLWLPLIEHSYNSMVHGSTRYAPFQLLFGFTPKGPLDLANPRAKRMQLLRENREDVDGFVRDLETHRRMARDAIAQAQAKQADAHDRGRRVLSFVEGEMVLINPHSLEWLESKGAGVKLRQRWIGPFRVLKRVSQNAYRLQLPKAFPGSNIINLEHIRPYVSSPSRFGARDGLPDTRKFLQIGERQDVEDLIDHRYDRRRKQVVYKTRFRNFSSQADKWLTPADLRDVPDILRAYQLRNNL
jgi:hypothetical protein